MNDTETMEKTKALLGGKILEITNPATRRIFLTVAPGDLREAVKTLRDELGISYLATISGLDSGENFEVLYHFAKPMTQLNVRTFVPKASPHLPSICGLIPGAILYERELQDMFGLVVDELPDPRPLVLPDDWPAGEHPLRKDWKFQRPEEKIPGGKS